MARIVFRIGVVLALGVTALTWSTAAQAIGYYAYSSWGSCGHTPGLFDLTSGIDVDGDGNVFVIDRNSERVQKFTNAGEYLMEWSVPGLSPSPTPFAICIDGEYVYVADGANNKILKYTLDGTFVLEWGQYGQGDGELNTPIGLAVGPDHSVYVSDLNNSRIQKFTSEGVYLTQWNEVLGSILTYPRGLVTDAAGNVYCASGSRVYVFTSEGEYLWQFGAGVLSGDAVDIDRDADGNFYVTDSFFGSVAKFSPTGEHMDGMGSFGSGAGQMRYPTGGAVDADGKVFVADYQNCRVVVFAPCPTMTVTVQPQSQALPYGATAVFTVTAPEAVTWFWVKDNQVIPETSRVYGVQANTLTIEDFQPSDVATYWCIMQTVCGIITESDHVTLSHSTAPSCFGPAATPPTGMAAWWSMEDGPGNTIPDVLHPVGNKNHASLTGAASLVAGKVGTAVRCDALGDGLHVPSTLSPRLAANSSGLSIDAWILPRSGSAGNALRMILQKGLGKKQTTIAGGQTALAPGYAFYLCNDGRLGFQMPDADYEPVRFEPAMPAMSMDEWHHVAVTIEPLVAGGGKFYVDGVQVASFTPPSGILGNLADLYVGRFTPQWGPEFPASAFNGDIDEVEIFVTAVDSAAIRKIWSAGCTGKRRVQVLAGSVASIREATASAEVCFAVQNLSSVTRNYSWSIAAAGPGAGCPSNIAVNFAAASGSFSVAAGERIELSTIASVNPGDLAAPFTRCYQLTVTDLADNGVMTADGAIMFTGDHISAKAACLPPQVGDFQATFGEAELGTGVATFTLYNDGPAGVTVPFELRTRDPDIDGPSGVLRLHGQPAGVEHTGSVFVPAGGSAPLPVDVALDEYEPTLSHEIVLAVDPDGNASFDDVAVSHVAAGDDTSLALLDVGPGSDRPTRTLSLRATPNPFGSGTAFVFTLTQASTVEVDIVDVSGRRVRRVLTERLESGEQRVTWDGRGDDGKRAPAGVYLGRVRTGGTSAVVRLLRVR